MTNIRTTPTNQPLLDFGFLNPSQLFAKTQENQISEMHVKIDPSKNDELINMTKTLSPSWELKSITKAQEIIRNTNISETPTFHHVKEEEKRTDYGMPVSEIAAIFSRKAKSAYDRLLLSTQGESAIAKADKFGIEYDANEIDFITLFNQIQQFERLIIQANTFGIDWLNFGYDVVGIEQEIEEAMEQDHNHRRESHWDFLNTRGLVT